MHSAFHFIANSLPGSGSGRKEAENAFVLPAAFVPTIRSAGTSETGSSCTDALATSGKTSSSTAGNGSIPSASSSFFSFCPIRWAFTYSSRAIVFDEIIFTSLKKLFPKYTTCLPCNQGGQASCRNPEPLFRPVSPLLIFLDSFNLYVHQIFTKSVFVFTESAVEIRTVLFYNKIVR